MNLTFRAAEKSDFAGAYRAMFVHLQHDERLRAIVEKEWNILIAAPAALCMVVEDSERPVSTRIVGYAETVFVTDAFVHYAKSAIHPYAVGQVVKHLPDGSWPLLNLEQVRVANSAQGLNGFTTRFAWDESLSPFDEQRHVWEYMIEKYTPFFRGYQFKELLFGAIGDSGCQGLERAGYLLRNSYADYVKAQPVKLGQEDRPYLLGITREEARQRMGALVTRLFAYTPPRFHFKPAEQELLLLALSGLSDEEIGLRLNLGRDAVKKRWSVIYAWVKEQMPTLLPQGEGGGRGTEKRRVLLRYLADHCEEMRPITPRKSRQGAESV